jgi:hypothetical protein
MVLENGEKIFIVTRRSFVEDLRRHFVGQVLGSTDMVVRAKGFVFVYDNTKGDFVRREDVRTRVFSLTDAGFIINILPNEASLEDIHYQVDENNQRIITDGKTFKMNASEFGAKM